MIRVRSINLFPILAALTLLPSLALAQLQISILDPDLPAASRETVLGTLPNLNPSHHLGTVRVGPRKEFTLRLRNLGSAEAVVSQMSVSGAGFSLAQPSLPFIMAAGKLQEATLRFQANTAASYSAAFVFNGATMFFLATVIPGPSLTTASPCTAVGAAFDFGELESNLTRSCEFRLLNPNQQPLTISTVSIDGEPFTGPFNLTLPLTLQPGQSAPFEVRFRPTRTAFFQGRILVDGNIFGLEARGLTPPIPRPVFEWGSDPLASGQQRRLTIRLPEPSPITATGQLRLSFTPVTTLVTDDPTVRLITASARELPFTLTAGSTQVRLDGSLETFLQTGSTAGRIRLWLTGIASGFAGGEPSAELVIPAQTVKLNLSETGRRTGGLDIHLTGFDNTYATGVMTFTFLDSAGRAIGAAPSRADFSDAFRAYYKTAPAGSTFDVLLRFPVSGDASQVRKVEVELVNSAGTTRTEQLEFP